jgi:hypothetical protein
VRALARAASVADSATIGAERSFSSTAGATRRICSSRHLVQEHSGIVSRVFGHFAIGDSLIGNTSTSLSKGPVGQATPGRQGCEMRARGAKLGP